MQKNTLIPSKSVKEFLINYSDFFKEPVVKKFFSDQKNYVLLYQVIESRDSELITELDKRFKIFYKNTKKIKYLSSLIRFFAIDYDKKRRRESDRYQLILDKTANNNGLDSFFYKEINYEEELVGKDWDSNLTDTIVINGIKKLSEKQQSILTLSYIFDWTNTEIASHFQVSPQNVSQIKIQAIKKLKGYLLIEMESQSN